MERNATHTFPEWTEVALPERVPLLLFRQGQVALILGTVGTPWTAWKPYEPSPQAFSPRTTYQKPLPAVGFAKSVVDAPERSSRQSSPLSPRPGPTGSSARAPRRTSWKSARGTAFQLIVVIPPGRESRTLLSTSDGAVGVPVQMPPVQPSPSVQATPSLHAVPSGAAGFEQLPVPELHVPATWHWSLAVHTTGFDPAQTPAWHVSVWVHRLPSLHAVPFGAAGFEQVPVPELHVPATWH